MSSYTTKQRRALITFFEEHPDELFSVPQIVAQLGGDAISPSAIYRNLSALTEDDVVRRHQKSSSREVFYQYVGCAHCRGRIHLSCTKCERLFHMSAEHQQQLLAQMAQLEGFALSTDSTVLHGLCDLCRQKEEGTLAP